MKPNTLFFSVTYPGVHHYLERFFHSLDSQTFPGFDILICNDGLPGLTSYIPTDLKPRTTVMNINATGPTDARAQVLEYIKKQDYTFIISGDADDYFAANRVEVCVKLLNEHAIVINDVSIVDHEGTCLYDHYFSRRLENESSVELDFLLDKNIFGLTNSSFRRDALIRVDPKPLNPGIIAYDWFLVTSMLMQNYSAIFTDRTTSFYRQHESNIAGLGKVTIGTIKKAYQVKKAHYTEFSSKDKRFQSLLHKLEHQAPLIHEINRLNLKNATNDLFWWEDTNYLK